jgi:hypothetical protein
MRFNDYPLNDLNLSIQNRIYAETVKMCVRGEISQDFLRGMDVQLFLQEHSTNIAYNVVLTLAGKQVCTYQKSSETVKDRTKVKEMFRHPATWWDGLKLSVLQNPPQWIVSTIDTLFGGGFTKWCEAKTSTWVRWSSVPVSTEIIQSTINKADQHYHVIPFPANQMDDRRQIAFLQWGTPYQGTSDEYHALLKIAEAARKGDQEDLYSALRYHEAAKAGYTTARP